MSLPTRSPIFTTCRGSTCPNCLQPHRWLVNFLTASCARWRSFRASSRKAAPIRLVVADPTDAASVRAAELSLGGPVALAVASFEDIATALAERLGEDTLAATRTRRASMRPSPTTISTACAILPAAHRSCAPSMICWRKPLSCAQPTFMSSHFAPGWCCRMRVDGLLQVAPDAARRVAAGADLAHQDPRRLEHCRTAAAARRRRSPARRAIGYRYSRCNHADARWRIRRHQIAAKRSRRARNHKARPIE